MFAAVALIALGPKRLPEFMKMIGKTLREVRKATSDLRKHSGIDEMMREDPIGLRELNRDIRAPAPRRPQKLSAEDRAREMPSEGVDIAQAKHLASKFEESASAGGVAVAPSVAVAGKDPRPIAGLDAKTLKDPKPAASPSVKHEPTMMGIPVVDPHAVPAAKSAPAMSAAKSADAPVTKSAPVAKSADAPAKASPSGLIDAATTPDASIAQDSRTTTGGSLVQSVPPPPPRPSAPPPSRPKTSVPPPPPAAKSVPPSAKTSVPPPPPTRPQSVPPPPPPPRIRPSVPPPSGKSVPLPASIPPPAATPAEKTRESTMAIDVEDLTEVYGGESTTVDEEETP